MGLRSIAVMAVILAVLWTVYVLTEPPAGVPEGAPQPELWSAQVEDLVSLTIALPAAGKEGAWIKDQGSARGLVRQRGSWPQSRCPALGRRYSPPAQRPQGGAPDLGGGHA
jgi:hypothetical protein